MNCIHIVFIALLICFPSTASSNDEDNCRRARDRVQRIFTSDQSQLGTDPVADYVAELMVKYPLEGHGNSRILYRGISDPNYGVESLLSYIKGIRRYELRSWVYSRSWQNYVGQGLSEYDASLAADKDTLHAIKEDIRSIESRTLNPMAVLNRYFVEQMQKTLIGLPVERKQGSIVAFHYGVKTSISINYLLAGMKKKNGNVGILFEVKENRPRGIGIFEEYHVFSHVPVKDLIGAYVVFPLADVEEMSSNNLETLWYYIEIVDRNPDGSAKVVSLWQVHFQGLNDTPRKTVQLFRHDLSDNSDGAKLKSLIPQHPHLERFINKLID